ncbi:MAG TPA: glycosyltransferase family 2 protein [Caulobacteraceae bacterium]|jgi:glycosyltransferase involved in cell wall biosynthesis|nr:glycosyltransferase family 2 protein [Caulobacteraceae bacterium]
MTAEVSIIIPTQRRLGPLALAARSVFAQAGVDPVKLELVVVDNDQIPSAAGVARALAEAAPFPVRYVHEPAAGVANARNAGLAAAEGGLIAFLDDDEEAPAGWLAALIATQRACDADVVFGPVRARADWEQIGNRVYFERFFSRFGPEQSGPIAHYYGCGDSLVRRAALPDPNRPFSAIRNQIGGEDDLLFGAMEQAGARFAWAAEAWVWEDPAPERLTLRYTALRAFAFGQGASAHCAAAGDRLGVARWMVLGVIQALVFGAYAAVKWLLRSPSFAFSLDRAARGLGKTLWWKPFKIRFYGLSAPAPARAAS